MRRLVIVVAVMLLAAGGASPALAASASGSGTALFGNTIEHIAFTAQQVTGTTAIGEAMINNASAHVRVHVDVNCLNVIGNFAIVSGIVRTSSDEDLVPAGWQAIFAVIDNGPGRDRDFMSIANFYTVGTGVDCSVPSEFDFVPANGNFRVDPAP
jgi:hypothetical protein